MISVGRSSNFRNIFGTQYKKELSYTEIKVNSRGGILNLIQTNSKYFAIPYDAGTRGALLIVKTDHVGKVSNTPALL